MNNPISDRITEYLANGGLFNPELMNPTTVRDLLIDARKEIERLEEYEWMYKNEEIIQRLIRLYHDMPLEYAGYVQSAIEDIEGIMHLPSGK